MKRGLYPFKYIAVILLMLTLIWAIPCALHAAFFYPSKDTVILHTSHHLIKWDTEDSSSNTVPKKSSSGHKSSDGSRAGVVTAGCIFIAVLLLLHHGRGTHHHDGHMHHHQST